jgi:hypothetical protein
MKLGLTGLIISALAAGIWYPVWAQSEQSPAVMLTTENVTIPITSNASQADGMVLVKLTDLTPTNITLRAVPLTQGDARGFIHFPDNGGRDTIRLDAERLHCQAAGACSIPYYVTEMWPPGLYQGAIEAWGPTGKVTSTPVSVVRLPSSFHPVVTSDRMHDGRISVDVDGYTATNFLLSIQNPTGSPPHHFELTACPKVDNADCADENRQSAMKAVNFMPSSFWLEPGATQTVSVVVQPCPTSGPCSANMTIAEADQHDTSVQTVISVNQYRSVLFRQAWLFIAVLIGSAVSVMLNNLFPTTRAKQSVREDLRRTEDMLRDCPNAGAALLDSLRSEATRLKFVVQQISFTDSTKETDLQNVRQATAVLAASTGLARRLSLLRTDSDGALLPIAKHALLRGKLLEAEEALRASDADSAASRLNEVQAKLTQGRNDGEQAELRGTLRDSIAKLMLERGTKPAQAPGAASDAPPPALTQPADRDPVIRDLVAQLDDDSRDYTLLNTTDLLDTERDFYVADVWTEYMERKLAEFDTVPPAGDTQGWQARKSAWVAFSGVFLQCLRRSPNSDQTQTMLDLLRHDTTLQDIVTVLKEDGSAQIECDARPKYLEAVDIALVLTNPLLRDVAAVRRFMSYEWSFGDETTQPPNVDHTRHYFRPPARHWLHKTPLLTYKVSVKVSVPFTDAKDITFKRDVTARTARPISVTRWTGWINFLVTASIAVVTAFGTKYATTLPNVVGWPDCLTAFMLGFGLDQLRDTVTSPPSASPPPFPVAPANPAPGTSQLGASART